MNTKLITTAVVAAFISTGAAFAQTGAGQDSSESGNAPYASAEEKAMFEDNATMMAPFFTDDTMTTMKSDDEVKSAFEAMGAEDQAQMKKACETAMQNRGSYGTITTGLCTQVGAL